MHQRYEFSERPTEVLIKNKYDSVGYINVVGAWRDVTCTTDVREATK